MNSNAVGTNAVKIAAAKAALPFWEAFFKGIVCNILVCLAVWLALAGRSVTDKIFAVIFPISAFVAAGFEHSVANMYFIPLGLMLKDRIPVSGAENLSWARTLVQPRARDLGQHRGRRRYGGAGLLFRLPASGQQIQLIRDLKSARTDFSPPSCGDFPIIIVDVSSVHEIFLCACLRGTSAGGSIRNSNRFVTSDRR